ncbi:glycosyltransferase family 4 protein [uncultured Methanobrevibacter sp.]|uniref:glycosyltransferase family 4 protein n=1 Tax=uncultured Methanobrevibacter sp. TaxID=253161 RepID=UPI0025F923ED|nr:glycosyltransferase family 4 protein [uncultured Methanobrevibacter sp.]
MKIFYIFTALTTKGGADRVISEKANWLASNGYDVAIVTDSQLGREPAFPLNSKVRMIDLGVDFSKEYGHFFLKRAYLYFTLIRQYRHKMERLLKNEKPDIVVSLLGREISFLCKIHDGSVKIGEVHTTKYYLRNFHLLEKKNLFFKLLTSFFRKEMNKQVEKLDALIVLSSQHRDDWSNVKNVYVIPNSIPFYPKTPASSENKKVIMVGRYNDAKGYDLLIPAWNYVHQRHPDWILNVYGSGEYYNSVVEWMEKYDLGNSMILHKPTEQIMEKYIDSSICVMSSRYEGFPMVLMEAMACGLPCVSFDCPYGPRNIIKDGEDGYLIEYLNVKALADGICKLIENPILRKEMGLKGRLNILRFSREKVMQQWVDLFDSLIKGDKS